MDVPGDVSIYICRNWNQHGGGRLEPISVNFKGWPHEHPTRQGLDIGEWKGGQPDLLRGSKGQILEGPGLPEGTCFEEITSGYVEYEL